MVLPDDVAYTTKSYKTKGDIAYDSRTKTISWTMPVMPGLTGRATPAEEMDIQVAITPGENKRGSDVILVQSLTATAVDSFTQETLNTTIQNELPNTDTATQGKGKVQ